MKRFYWEAPFGPTDWKCCDRCGDNVKSVGSGKIYWDRRRKAQNAQHRYICEDCFFAWQQIRRASYRNYKAMYFKTGQVFADGEGI